MTKKLVILLALCVAAFSGIQAQQIQKLPVDSAVRVGHLDNGLTYYIRHNELPKQRAEFHIAQAVGATLENAEQNGLAHFLEHMCFNGTEHFPGKLIINYFESVGVNFGGNINAYTSLDKTVYRLSEVPTYREGIIDSALLVMHDWSCAVSLLPEEIDAERGVIREEWRTGNTANRRMQKRSNEILYAGSQYATHDVIGDTAVINNFSYDALRAYYKKWYGPDLQAIIVVGDVDVDYIENKIKELWADVPARTNRGERPWAEIADNKEPIIAIVQDPEAQNSILSVIYKHDPMPDQFKGTNVSYMQGICQSLISSMLSERMQEITVKPDAPIVGSVLTYTDLFPTKDAFYTLVAAKEGQEKEAYNLLLEQTEKMRRYGFTDDELQRAKTEMLNSYEKAYNERNNTRNISYVNEYIGNFLEKEPIPGIAFEKSFVERLLPVITLDMVNKVAANYVSQENALINFKAPDKETVQLPTEEEALAAFKNMPNLDIQAPEVKEVDYTLVKKTPLPGGVKKNKTNDDLGTTEWTLYNGIRVIFKQTEFKQDEIRMEAYSLGGESLIKTEDLPSAELACEIMNMMGIGDFSATDLQKALTGKTVSVSSAINANTESISGSSSVKDFETMLQLVYLGFTAPRRDEEAYQTFINLMEQSLKNRNVNPKAAFQDSISTMSTGNSPRNILWSEDMLKQVNLDKAMEIYAERFKNPADFTFTFVGNIDPKDFKTRRLICTWLGSLKTQRKNHESIKDQGVRVPKGVNKNYFTRSMTTKTGSNRIQYTSYDIPYNLQNELTMEIIGRVLSTRYLESIREREGGSYGVGTAGYMQPWPVAKAALIMQFDTDPEKQEKLMSIIHEEVQTIIANGPLDTDLQKEKESMLKDFKENVEKNGWWVNAIENYQKFGINYLTDYEKAVNNITAESVQALLKKLVASGNMFEVVMMPE